VPSGWCGAARLQDWVVVYRDDAYDIYFPLERAKFVFDRRGRTLAATFP